MFFKFPMFIKELLDLIIILFQDQLSFVIKCLFDVVKLVGVVLSHIVKLFPHGLNQFVYILSPIFDRFHILIILHFQLLLKHLNQCLLLLNNLLACIFLTFNILYRRSYNLKASVTLASSSQSSFSSSSYQVQSISTFFL